MSFETRYKKLNAAQKKAVDQIDGPLMVVAGPGTGKTELLTMRAANILKKTDTSAQNILCLTFTESAAAAMRERLADIIGADSYKVAIHTFHSFGSEIINRNGDYFYDHAHFQPASELDVYEVLRDIFDGLDHTNPLASQLGGEYTQLRDTVRALSELKKSGLTSDELLQVLDDNERVLDACERELAELFSNRISAATKDGLAPIAATVAKLPPRQLPPQIVSLASVLALDIAHAVDAATDENSTKPITAWKNKWLEKNEAGSFVFKDRRRIAKLRALSYVYYQYLLKMQESELYDFDDMVLKVVHALEVFPDLRFNLQEQYLYLMVDEYQDTNLAQARLLRSLTLGPNADERPNVMVVGDDDQAIYRFQGAELSNVMQFKETYGADQIVLKDNYRSTAPILNEARGVITQGQERLENYFPELDKSLTPHREVKNTAVTLHEFAATVDERAWLADEIARQVAAGVTPGDITVLARRHSELVELVPYLTRKDIAVAYEHQSNALESEVLLQLELLAKVVCRMAESKLDEADALLPELLSHPAWHIPAEALWQLSLTAYQERRSWLDIMSENPSFQPLHRWLTAQAKACRQEPLEPMIDSLLGRMEAPSEDFTSPLFDYFFGADQLEKSPERYLRLLEDLRTIRTHLREHTAGRALKLADFLEFLTLNRQLGTSIISVRSAATAQRETAINLMTAHKSKGMEFDHVYILGAVDSSWGERVRVPGRAITYPENLQLQPAGSDYDERLRLFYVAMTRAKSHLTISYSRLSDNDKPLQPASFLVSAGQEAVRHEPTAETAVTLAEQAWYQPLMDSSPNLKSLLAPTLENYKLSATHLNDFLDVSRGGPQAFLIRDLLHFPESKSPEAAYGSAIHTALQRAHVHLNHFKMRRPLEDVLQDFETALRHWRLSDRDFEQFLKRGTDSLQHFLAARYESFGLDQTPEVSFASQQSHVGQAHLTGFLDVATIDKSAKTIAIIDYKTGKPCLSWKGRTPAEKIKLHRYRQQLLFYKLLVEHSRDYSGYRVSDLAIEFVDPTPEGNIIRLDLDPDEEEHNQLASLVERVYAKICALDLPDVSAFSADYAGIRAFEDNLLGTH